MASEVVEYNFVRILYSEEGKIEAYLSGYGIECEYDSVDGEHEVKNLTAIMLDPDEKDEKVARYYLKRDEQDNIVEVSDPITKNTIKAPKGWTIRPELTENVCFWESDLNGGWVLLNFYVEPIKKDVQQYTVKKYCFYELQTESTYTDGVLTWITVFSPETHKLVATIEKKYNKDDGTTMYDKKYPNDKDIYRSMWKDGVLLRDEKISQYGTTLRQILYVTSHDKQAVLYYYKKYDYKTKKLIRVDEEREDRCEFLATNKEEDVMVMYEEMHKHWNTKYSVDRYCKEYK